MISDDEIKKMNRKYRKVNRITDVISFWFPKSCLWETYTYLQTDLKKTQKKYGFTHEQELCYLIIHGILHLEGYTDYDAENKSLMFSRQD
jgi:probable rRNA maturation factor